MRLLPADIKNGDEFELIPCPKCGNAFKARLTRKGALHLN